MASTMWRRVIVAAITIASSLPGGAATPIYTSTRRLDLDTSYNPTPFKYYWWAGLVDASCKGDGTSGRVEMPPGNALGPLDQSIGAACSKLATLEATRLGGTPAYSGKCLSGTGTLGGVRCQTGFCTGYLCSPSGPIYSTFTVCNIAVYDNGAPPAPVVLIKPTLPPLLVSIQYTPSGALSYISHFQGEANGVRLQLASASGSGKSIAIAVGDTTIGAAFDLKRVTAYSVAMANGSGNTVAVPSEWDRPSWKDDQFWLWVNPRITIATACDGTRTATLANDDSAYTSCFRSPGQAALVQMLGAQLSGVLAIPPEDTCRNDVFDALDGTECVALDPVSNSCLEVNSIRNAILAAHPLYNRSYPPDLANIDVTQNDKGERQQRFITIKERRVDEPENVKRDWGVVQVPMANPVGRLAGNVRCDATSNGVVASSSVEKFRRRFVKAETGETFSLDHAFMASASTCTFDWWRVDVGATQDCSGMAQQFWLDRVYGTLIGIRVNEGVGPCVPGR